MTILIRGATRVIVFICLALSGLAQAQTPAPLATPVSLAIHGPSTVYEATSAEYRTVVTWSDGTKSSVSAVWTSSNPGLASVLPFGRFTNLLVGTVGANTTVTVSATYFDPSGPISASKVVTILDASSYPSVSHSLVVGWNLLGNSIAAPISVVSIFGDQLQPVAGVTAAVVSVWKWDGVNGKWAFFSPTMTPIQNASYAAAKGHSVLQVVHPGEGYWVNISQSVALPPRSGGSVLLSSASVVSGWNLLATGQQLTPSQFNVLLSTVPPAPGTVPQNFVTLWGWDAATAKWIFYAPSLEASGGLPAVKAYADANGYLDFATLNRQLGHGVGFWINSAMANTTSNLTPLGQAKAMFSELRTTVRAYSNDLKTGFLDAQSTRIRNDLQFKVTPVLPWAVQYGDLIQDAMRLYEDFRNGNTSSYFVQAGTTAGTVRASRTLFFGSEQISCFSNDMAGTQVTPGLLTVASCTWMDFNFGAYTYSFPNRTQLTQRVNVMAGATANDFSYEAIKRQRLESWNGSFYQFVSDTQIGATRTGTFSRTYLGATTNVSNFSFAGDLPPKDPGADRDTVNLTGTRTVQDAANGIYRSSISGSIASKDTGGVAMVTLLLASGSYFDAKEDANGNPLPNSLQAVHVVGKAETSASRFTGTIDLNAFARDADNAEYVPASVVFDGLAEDLSAGGAGTFLTGRFTVTLNNLASYHSLQLESASNFLRFDTGFVGTIQAPSRPEMRLTAGSSRTGLDTYSINTNYSYGPVSVTGTGTLNTFNTDNSSLTLTNQDGITVTFQPHADAIVSKGGVTLGIIPFGSTIVYFIDGYFESL